jgi:hypothetical protein
MLRTKDFQLIQLNNTANYFEEQIKNKCHDSTHHHLNDSVYNWHSMGLSKGMGEDFHCTKDKWEQTID